MRLPQLIGMVHLGPLPGSAHPADLDSVLERAAADASVLAETGYDAIMVENFGDAPFYKDDVPKITVAAMTSAVITVANAARLPVGVNVLRNDALAALAVAAAAGAAFIRVNVLSGTMYTDQGIIEGQAAAVARARQSFAPGVAIMADCFVKHAAAPPGVTFEQALVDLWERSGADAVVVSGSGTGRAPDASHVAEARDVLGPDAPIFLGSGVDAANAASLLAAATGAIIGSSLKVGRAADPIDRDLAAKVALAARQALL